MGYSAQSCKEYDTTERLTLIFLPKQENFAGHMSPRVKTS